MYVLSNLLINEVIKNSFYCWIFRYPPDDKFMSSGVYFYGKVGFLLISLIYRYYFLEVLCDSSFLFGFLQE